MIDIPKNKKVILFDGICNLCNDAVIKVLQKDQQNIFVFAAIQSRVGQEIIRYLKIDITKIDSIILYKPGLAYYIKSEAALKIMSEFDGFWKLMQIFTILPNSLNNFVYDFIAKNRYKWFGKKETCMIPTPALKAKFLDDNE